MTVRPLAGEMRLMLVVVFAVACMVLPVMARHNSQSQEPVPQPPAAQPQQKPDVPAQDESIQLKRRSAEQAAKDKAAVEQAEAQKRAEAGKPAEPANIALVVNKDTPLRVRLESKVGVRHLGQLVKARVIEDVYRFDRVVIPAGSEVLGRIATITPASTGHRVRSALNAEFSPPSKVEVTFDYLQLADGRQFAIETDVTPGIADPVRLQSPTAKEKSKLASAAERAKQSAQQQVAQAKKQAHDALDEIRAPGKKQRLKEYGKNWLFGQLPYRPQYLPQGTLYEAILRQPLDFGSVLVSPEQIAAPGTPPPPDSEVKARLLTPLSSKTTQKDEEVRVLITAPLFSADHKLILPEGSLITGRVTTAQPARSLHRNGQLQMVLNRIEWPSGEARRVEASLDSLTVSQSANLSLNDEGGTAVKDSKTRYLQTGLAVAVALAAAQRDDDDEDDGGAGHSSARGASGGYNFRLIGLVLGYAVPSRAVSVGMGAYGAGQSFYDHFLSRGREVVLEKHTPMEVSFGRPPKQDTN